MCNKNESLESGVPKFRGPKARLKMYSHEIIILERNGNFIACNKQLSQCVCLRVCQTVRKSMCNLLVSIVTDENNSNLVKRSHKIRDFINHITCKYENCVDMLFIVDSLVDL